MTFDTLICANQPMATLAGDEIPALEDGEVPLCDADGNRIGTVRIRGDRMVAVVGHERMFGLRAHEERNGRPQRAPWR